MLETTQLVGGVFSDVLARMAFMFTDPTEPAELAFPGEGAVVTSMGFAGARHGSLTLAGAAALCPALAANVLGLEPDEALALEGASDAFQELLNVTCGHVVTALAGEAAVLDLAAPELGRIDAAGWQALQEDPGTTGFMVEGHAVLLCLRLHD